MATSGVTTETEVANYALIRLGRPPNISDLDSGTDKITTAARRMFPDTRDEVAVMLPWSSLMTRTAISTTDASAESQFSYKQTIANSVLRVVDLIDTDGTENPDWRREQNVIYYNLATGFIRHVEQQASVSIWDPLFLAAFEARFASKLAVHVYGDLQLSMILQQEYVSILSTAVFTKAVQESEANMELLAQIDTGLARIHASMAGFRRTVE